MLDNFDDLIIVLTENSNLVGVRQYSTLVKTDEMYCPTCGDHRRMYIQTIVTPQIISRIRINYAGNVAEQLVPSLFIFSCSQCDTKFTIVIYEGAEGPDLAVLQSCRGGLTTPNTPEGVAFYLDQAHRAQSTGANSASIAMFRGALEHILFEQGYKQGMLGKKINDLGEDIKAATAPKWALDLDTEFLKVIKDLGNGSIHPNDGDVTKQAALDKDLLYKVRETFLMLLFVIYELPSKKDRLLSGLKEKAKMLNR